MDLGRCDRCNTRDCSGWCRYKNLPYYLLASVPSLLLLWAVGTIVVNLVNAIYGFHNPPTHNVTPITR